MKLPVHSTKLTRFIAAFILILICSCSSDEDPATEENPTEQEISATKRDNRSQPTAEDAYIAVSLNGSDANDGKLVEHGGTGPMASLQAAVLAAADGDAVYLYSESGNVEFIFEETGISFSGVANNIHFSSWPGQFHKMTANDLPGNLAGADSKLPGAMGLFEFGQGANIDGIKFSHFEAEALLNVWAFFDNTHTAGRTKNGEIFNVIARCTGDAEIAGAPLTANSRSDSNAAIVHFEEEYKNDPQNDGWEIHNSILEHSLPISEQSINSGGVYTIGQRDINVHHVLFRNLKSGMFYKWASSGEPNIVVEHSVFEDVDQPLKGTARGIVVRNNLFVGGTWNSFVVGQDANSRGGEDVLIEYNTFHSAGSSFEPWENTFINFVVRNNIFTGTDYFSSVFTTDSGDPSLTASATINNNIFEKERDGVFPESDPADAAQNIFGTVVQFQGSSRAPVIPADYALTNDSPGKNASTDENDLGADVSKITGWIWE